jgi:hypothetical protein
MAGVDRIVYAAPKEMVPDLGVPAPGAELMVGMQDRLRLFAADQVQHVPIEGAEEPFSRYLAAEGRWSGSESTSPTSIRRRPPRSSGAGWSSPPRVDSR